MILARRSLNCLWKSAFYEIPSIIHVFRMRCIDMQKSCRSQFKNVRLKSKQQNKYEANGKEMILV